ncbi:MAG: toll/interleukin-1 receptor domain-containing protein [Desulfobacterales bacterium]|nr:toll/interleukin-1 receptor domain-containing protein [Desulfobacterales bacterium]
MRDPICFISYSWESDEHIDWVKRLAEELYKNGVKTYLDQWDVKPGTDLPHFMESSIRESDFVLLISTPTFCKKANAGEGGVGYEKNIVTGEIFGRASPDTKFVPILRKGDSKESLPSYLKSKAYIDFCNDDDFQKNLTKLLRHLYDEPEIKRPELGPKPSFLVDGKKLVTTPLDAQVKKGSVELHNGNKKSRETPPSDSLQIKEVDSVQNTEELNIRRIKELRDFAYSADGLNMSTEKANAWVFANVNSITNEDIKRIKELRDFAYSADGLNMTTEKANEWVFANLRKKIRGDMRDVHK